MVKNHIYQLIDRKHVKKPKIKNLLGVTGRKFLKNLALSGIDEKLFKDHLKLLDELHEHIRKTEAWIEKELKNNSLIGVLNSLPEEP